MTKNDMREAFDTDVEVIQCDICGDHHEIGDVPRECETGDGL